MKTVLIMICTQASWTVLAQNVAIPDAIFKMYCVNNFDGIDGSPADGEISFDEAAQVLTITCFNLGINDITGIEAFVNLETLVASNNQLTGFPSLPPSLIVLYFSNNNVTSVPDLNLLPNLSNLDYSHNIISDAPDLSAANLSLIDCSGNPAPLPDLSNQNALLFFFARFMKLTTFPDFSGNPLLVGIYLEFNEFTDIPPASAFPANVELIRLDGNLLTGIPDLSSLSNLNTLWLEFNWFTVVPDFTGYPEFNLRIEHNYLDLNDCADLLALSTLNINVTYDPQGINFERYYSWPRIDTSQLAMAINHNWSVYTLTCD